MIKKFNDLKKTDIENKNFFLTYGKNNGTQDEILHNYFIKDYSKNDIIFLRLFKLIDAMPMRKNEMKNEKC